MNQEELKKIILTHVSNLTAYDRAEIEYFFSECEGITVENYMDRLEEWRKSKNAANVHVEIEKELEVVNNAKIQLGLDSIAKGTYALENTRNCCFGTYVVVDNSTGLRGLITTEKEEVLPCIFDSISVKPNGSIETTFMRKQYNLFFTTVRKSKGGWFKYGKSGAYYLCGDIEKQSNGKCYRDFSENAIKLIGFLNKNHQVEHNEE